MVGFFLQETMLSIIYIKETLRLLKLSESIKQQNDAVSFDNTNANANTADNTTNTTHLRSATVRKTMYQLLAINVLIITMDLALLATEFANLYLIETTLKGVVYSVKLKLEFAVLGKLVQFVRDRADSDFSVNNGNGNGNSNGHSNRYTGSNMRAGSLEGRQLEKTDSDRTASAGMFNTGGSLLGAQDFGGSQVPDFVDASRMSGHVRRAESGGGADGWETRGGDEHEGWRRRGRGRGNRGSWIEEEMDRHGIV